MNIKILISIALILVIEGCSENPKKNYGHINNPMKLWYQKPANEWIEALPVGNGRLGAMVFGNPAKETIQLNENTIWAGSPHRNDNPEAKEALPKVRQLIFQGRYKAGRSQAGRK